MAIGIFALFSGTLIVLLLASYGAYAVLRDTGLLEQLIQKSKSIWRFLSNDVELNVRKTFVMRNLHLLPKRNALYICHPHGLFGYSWLLHFCYGIGEWPQEVPKPVLAIHSILFRIPFVRDVLEQCNCIEAKETTIQECLGKGKSVAIVTGGIEEMVYNGNKQVKLVLKKRKGYARIAKQCGAPIVPLFTRGENELFPTETFWLWSKLRHLVRKWTGLEVPLPSWTSMKRWIQILHKPLETPIETYVVGIVDTQKQNEDAIRAECIAIYKQFFQKESISADIIA